MTDFQDREDHITLKVHITSHDASITPLEFYKCVHTKNKIDSLSNINMTSNTIIQKIKLTIVYISKSCLQL